MPTSWIRCRAGEWVRIYASASSGFVYVWTPGRAVADYRYWSASLPWYWAGQFTIDQKLALWVGTPTPYIELWINPQADGDFLVS